MNIDVGQQAPDFSLLDQDAKEHSLKKYQGKWVVLYFYPKDNTPGCTKQACDIRDDWQTFKDKGVVVLGVSPDSVESHARFAEKHKLPFTLLADPDKEVATLYGAWQEKNMYGVLRWGIQRSSVIINPDGIIAKVYKRVGAKQHAGQVLKALDRLMVAHQ
jgi:peroxiredoxin Q/BCP